MNLGNMGPSFAVCISPTSPLSPALNYDINLKYAGGIQAEVFFKPYCDRVLSYFRQSAGLVAILQVNDLCVAFSDSHVYKTLFH